MALAAQSSVSSHGNNKTALRPDGDAEVQEEFVNQMKVPQCPRCSGLLKPNVVFYGSTVNKEIVNYLFNRLQKLKRYW